MAGMHFKQRLGASRSDPNSRDYGSVLTADLSTGRRRAVAIKTFVWCCVAVFALAVLGFTAQRILVNGINGLLTSTLSTVRDSASSQVKQVCGDLMVTATNLAADPGVRQMLAHPDQASEQLAHLAQTSGVDEILLVSMDGRLLVASGGRRQAIASETLLRLTSGTSTMFLPVVMDTPNSASLAPEPTPLTGAAAPLPGGDGWVLVRTSALARFGRVVSSLRPGQSGETYLFDARGMMVTRSRFEPQLEELGLLTNKVPSAGSALHIHLRDPGDGSLPIAVRPLTMLVAQALTRGRGQSQNSYPDYRGIPVLGAWDWLPEYGLGVAVEIDQVEAFAAERQLQWLFTGLFGLLACAALGVLVWFRRMAVLQARAQSAERQMRELGQYELLEEIGKGGMGRVYRARHRLLKRPTAIKLLNAGQGTNEDLARFEREANVTAGLTSPHTVRVFDFGRGSQGEFYLVMELLSGLDLTRMVVQHGPLPEARVVHFLLQVCESLAEAHASGLVHRDLKPQNIFACRQGRHHDVIKVLDFGLAKQSRPQQLGEALPAVTRPPDSNLTGIGQVAGTPGFMAPEQAMGQPIDGRSDLYALGCCAYWLLTATQVFPYDQGASAIYKHLRITPERPGDRLPRAGITPEMDAILLHLLAKEPSERLQTADELAAKLRRLPCFGTWTEELAADWWRTRLVSPPSESKAPAPEEQ